MLNAFNNRRNVGPEKSVVPIPETLNADEKTENNLSRLESEKNKEIRPIFIKTGVIQKASGSAYFESGNLKVICSVHGPRQTQQAFSSTGVSSVPTASSSGPNTHSTHGTEKKIQNLGSGTLNCDFKFSSFSTHGKRKEYPQDTQEKEYSLIIHDAIAPAIRLELFPKSSIDVHIQVLDCDGQLASLAAAITCASAALVNAGIDMVDTVVASSAGLFGDQVALDCNAHEESCQTGSVLISYMPSLNMVTHFIQNGETAVNSAVKTMDLCLDACTQIHGIVYKALVDSAFRDKKE